VELDSQTLRQLIMATPIPTVVQTLAATLPVALAEATLVATHLVATHLEALPLVALVASP